MTLQPETAPADARVSHAGAATAHTNIALIKYWGKRDEALFLPANGSLSLTLDALYTRTTVRFSADYAEDVLVLDGVAREGSELAKVSTFLDKARALAGVSLPARIESINHVPTAAGLASSASGFAALAGAVSQALGLDTDPTALSRLARQGSGSACRSIWGGFVEWRRGERPDGQDSHGVPIAPQAHWDLRMLVTVLEKAPKAVSSRDGMRRTVETSPFYPGWLATLEPDLQAARRAIAARDFEALGTVAEANALKMHATTLGAVPPFTYWAPATLAVLGAVQAWRAEGLQAYCTMDAGPNVKVLCLPEDEAALTARLAALPGVTGVIACAPGPGLVLHADLPSEAR